MLEIVSSDFLKAVNYLKDHYPIEEKLTVHVVEGYDTIETPTGKGFGVFVLETSEIFIAGDMPEKEENLIKVFAHEFKHFLQWRDKKPFDEADADAFAEEIYKKIKRQQEKTEARKQIDECIEACIDCDGIATINKNCSNCGVMSKLRDAGVRAREERRETWKKEKSFIP